MHVLGRIEGGLTSTVSLYAFVYAFAPPGFAFSWRSQNHNNPVGCRFRMQNFSLLGSSFVMILLRQVSCFLGVCKIMTNR